MDTMNTTHATTHAAPHAENAFALAALLRESVKTELSFAQREHKDAMTTTRVKAHEMELATRLWAQGHVGALAQTRAMHTWRAAVWNEEVARVRVNELREQLERVEAQLAALPQAD